MPKIPVYEAQSGLSPALIDPRSASAFGAGLAELGGRAAEIATATLKRQQDADNAAWVARTLSGARSDWTARWLQASEQAPAGAPEFTKGVIGEFDNGLPGLLEGAPSPEARAMAEERLGLFREDLLSRSLVFESKARVAKRQSDVGDSVNLTAAAVRGDPQSFAAALTDLEDFIEAADLPADLRGDMLKDARAQVAEAALSAVIDADPERAKRELVDGAWAPYLDTGRAEQFINSADSEIRRRQAEGERRANEAQAAFRAQASILLEDEIAARQAGTSTGMLDEKIIRRAFPDTADKIIGELATMTQLRTDAVRLALLPPAEQDNLIAGYQPEGEGFAAEAGRQAQLQKVAAGLREEFAADPSGYAYRHSPAVQAAWDKAAQSNAPDDLQAAAAVTLETQRGLGAAEHELRVLTDAQAKDIVERLKSAGGESAADTMQGMAGAYGGQWPRVYRELVAADLPPLYRVLTTTDGPTARKTLGEVLSLPAGDVKALAGDRAAEFEGQVDQAMQPFLATLQAAPNGAEVAADYREAALRLAYKYGDGARAFDELIGSRYDFIEFERIAARAPKGKGGRAADNAAYILKTLKAADLADPGGAPELTPEQRQEIYLENVRAGQWVTNGDDDGWLLLDILGQPVARAGGGFVEFKFADMLRFQIAGGRGGVAKVPVPPVQAGGRL